MARNAGTAPETIIETALERLALGEALESGQAAVADMRAFAAKHRFTVDRGGKSWREFIHEAHKY